MAPPNIIIQKEHSSPPQIIQQPNVVYKDIVLTTVRDLKSASRAEIVEVVGSSLPESLDNKQKIKKISNILASLKELGRIGSEGNGRGARWFYIE